MFWIEQNVWIENKMFGLETKYIILKFKITSGITQIKLKGGLGFPDRWWEILSSVPLVWADKRPYGIWELGPVLERMLDTLICVKLDNNSNPVAFVSYRN